MADEKRFRKGFFGRIGLPFAQDHLHPASRNHFVRVGIVLGFVLAVVLLVGFWLSNGGLASSGPLSYSHSGLEAECASCHVAFEGAADRRCLACHDVDTPGQSDYRTVAHFQSSSRSGQTPVETPTKNCSDCHREHRGRDVPITRVANSNCGSCHEVSSFSEHPALFETSADGEGPEPRFLHAVHITGDRSNAAVCSRCHQLGPAGERFSPVDFERHCTECHQADAEASEPSWAERYRDWGGLPARTSFRHSAHLLLRTCSDCHSEAMKAGLSTDVTRPGIETCQQCHGSGKASGRCTHCHQFHSPAHGPGAPESGEAS